MALAIMAIMAIASFFRAKTLLISTQELLFLSLSLSLSPALSRSLALADSPKVLHHGFSGAPNVGRQGTLRTVLGLGFRV